MLEAALASIRAQTVQVDEIVVVDDGSPEPVVLAEHEGGPPVRLVRLAENSGIGAARNAGIAAATGTYLSFLDSDDLWVENKIALQLKTLDENPQVELVYGRVSQFFDEETTEDFRTRFAFKSEILDARLSSAALMSRAAFESVGDYATSIAGVDVDWQLRAAEVKLPHIMLSDIVFLRRVHEGNSGLVNRDDANRSRVLALKRSLDRRRALGELGST